MRVETAGIVLRRIPYRETSELLYWLTPRHGVVHSLAKGIHRPRSSFKGPVDLLDLCSIAYNDRRQGDGLVVLSRLEPRRRWRGLRASSARLRAAFTAIEVLREFVQPEQDVEELFATFRVLLDQLEHSDRAGFLLAWFRARSLTLLGHRPELEQCISCGAAAGRGGSVDLRQGGALCASCRRGRSGLARFSGAVLALLRDMGEAVEPDALIAAHPPLPPSAGRELQRFLRDYTSHVLEKRLRLDTP